MGRVIAVFAVVLASLIAVVALPATASAYDPLGQVCGAAPGSKVACNNSGADPFTGPDGAIVSVTSILALIAGVVSIVFLILGGIKYITSNGEASNVASGKNTIIAALIGLVIAALARPIILFVVGKL